MEERQWKVLSQTQESVRYADGKAVALLGIQGVLIGLVIAFMKDFLTGTGLDMLSTAFFIAGVISLVAAMVFTFLSFTPRLNNGGVKSPIYFRSIAADFKSPSDYNQYLNENFCIEEKVCGSLAEQVHTNSRIASIKFKWVSWSTGFTMLGLVFWAVFLIIILF